MLHYKVTLKYVHFGKKKKPASKTQILQSSESEWHHSSILQSVLTVNERRNLVLALAMLATLSKTNLTLFGY